MTTSLQELVYFGTAWQLLQEKDDTPDITLRSGWQQVRIERTADGDFFAGIVEKLDRFGHVTDVVVAFAGAQGADAVQALSLDQGIVLDEPLRAAELYESLWIDPRYAAATLHVTGHSLGSVYSQFVLAESIASHGETATAARADFTGFGVAGGYDNAADHYGISVAEMDPYFTGYSAINDPTVKGGVEHLGTAVLLPAFTGLDGVLAPLNLVAAHWPTTYISALGLPSWLTTSEKQAITQNISGQFVTGNSIDPSYGTPGATDLIVDGTAGSDALRGMAGDDTLIGSLGVDTLWGGSGHDLFRFETLADSGATATTADRILDFASGDRIDFSQLDADLAKFGNQDFELIAGRDFSAAGQVATWVQSGVTWVAANVDGDNAADLLIRINGVHYLGTNDFVLETDGVLVQTIHHLPPILPPLDGVLF